MSNDRPVFRLHVDEHEQRKGKFNFRKQAADTILNGEFHAFFILTHFVIGAYIGYRYLFKWGMWPETLARLVLATAQGMGTGGAIGYGFMRWISPASRKIRRRVKERSATDEEVKELEYIQLGFAISVYTIGVCILWRWFPSVSPISAFDNPQEWFGQLFTNIKVQAQNAL